MRKCPIQRSDSVISGQRICHFHNHRAVIAQLRPCFKASDLDRPEPRCPFSRDEDVVDVIRLVLVVAEVNCRARCLSVGLAEVMVVTTD